VEIIIENNKNVLKMLGKIPDSIGKYRLLNYCVILEVAEGILVFNTLTRALVLLTRDEYEERFNNEYLKEHWFTVPEDYNEKGRVELVRWINSTMLAKQKNITSYTILTTTDCNARCYYCYEMGYQRVSMTEKTAIKVAEFIREKSGGEPVKINWFGGEPLYNAKVIDCICKSLQENQIAYESIMISNGYLFDDDTVNRAVNLWKLQKVQITLDGTEEVYNGSKAYIYREGSAYQRVLSNIERLLDAGISVIIRMNIQVKNADDLLNLTEELVHRFKERENIWAYAHVIFEDGTALEDLYSQSDLEKIYGSLLRIEERLISNGLFKQERLARKVKQNHCMADSGKAVLINPNGALGLCEHFAESNLIGHIDSPEQDQEMKESWMETKELSACEKCFSYPECIRLKKCPHNEDCPEQKQEYIRKKIQRAMYNEFVMWQNKKNDKPED